MNENQLRNKIRTHLLEHYAENGLDHLSPREVQQKLKIIEQQAAQKKVRLEIRKVLIEHYSQNGLDDLSPREVQRRLRILEAKASKKITSKAKMDKKLLGSKKMIGNSAPNASWIKGKPKKHVNINMGAKAEKMKGKPVIKTEKLSSIEPKFAVKKSSKPSSNFKNKN